jgi:rhamnulokinase
VSAPRQYVACDLGAESGRVIVGEFDGAQVRLQEIHRFLNRPLKIGGSLRWNIAALFDELKTGLRKAAALGAKIESVSVDSWGLDYVYTGAGQPMLSLPYHYRDARTDRTYAAAQQSPGRQVIFSETGIQFMAINTLYHMMDDLERSPRLLDIADQFLTIADYLHFLLSGVAAIEVSLASTTQLYNPASGQWSERLIKCLGFPRHIFPRIVPSATRLGPLLPEIAAETGAGTLEVVATCSHDTGAAVAAVPATGEDWAYLSSGTWSLMGVELRAPLLSEAALACNFTNEAGLAGTTRFLKNIVGLWILQESRRAWQAQGHDLDYAMLAAEAATADPFRALINPNDPRFWKPDDMPEKIAAYCRETGQPPPESPGQYTRCIYESLALLYRRTLDELEQVTGRQITRLHIVGGGSQSTLLNQFAANATQRPVLAGPVEATALGNILIQAITLGHLESPRALREVVQRSFEIQRYEPEDAKAWQDALRRFASLPAGSIPR